MRILGNLYQVLQSHSDFTVAYKMLVNYSDFAALRTTIDFYTLELHFVQNGGIDEEV